MKRLLCTIGFAGKSAEEFFSLLREASAEMVVDIRQNRAGQLSAFAKHPDLAYFLRSLGGIAYLHEPQLAPSADLLRAYRKNKDWPAYEAAFLSLLKDRGIPQRLDTTGWASKTALLCSEPTPEKCHRRIVADLIAGNWRGQGHEVEIRHLVATRTGSTSKRTRKGSADS